MTAELHSTRFRLVVASPPKPLRTITVADAARLYPDSPQLQSGWLRAVATLRSSAKRGWILDGEIKPTKEKQ